MSDVAQTLAAVEERAKQLPTPTGYRLLCAVPKAGDRLGEIIIKAEDTIRTEELTTVVLYVVSMGPDAYKDPVKFPAGPWCAVGDFIIVRSYSGTRVKIHNHEFRLINDDSVEAVVENPVGINRAG